MAEALVKKKLMLEGLDCANCCNEIEKGWEYKKEVNFLLW